MTQSQSYKIIIAILTGTLVNACSLLSQNLTPSNFPYEAVPVLNPDDLYYGARTQSEVIELMLSPARRFLVETKRKNVTDVSAFVTVNGVKHRMGQFSGSSGNGLWTYQSPDICQSSYDYFFTLSFKAGWYGWKNYTRGSASQPFTVTVSHNGEFVWYIPGGPPQNGNGTVRLSEQSREQQLYLQNLGTTRLRVDLIGFSASDPDFSDFDLFNRPPMPVILECGGSMNFGIRYVGSGDSDDALDMLIKTSNELGLGNWVENPSGILITLTGGPGPG